MRYLPVVEGVFEVDDEFFDKYSPRKNFFVISAIFDHGKCLFVKQKHRDYGWEMVGGKVEPGESPEESLRREALEEVGLGLKNLRLAAFIIDHLKAPKGSFTIYGLGYYAEANGEELRPDGKEIVEAKFLGEPPGKLAWNDLEFYEVAKEFKESVSQSD